MKRTYTNEEKIERLKGVIEGSIRENNSGEITGNILQDVLIDMVDVLSEVGGQVTEGPQGVTGMQGATGPEGPQGATGVAGKDGTDGINGKDGEQGVTGPQGATGVAGKGFKIIATFPTVEDMEAAISEYEIGDMVMIQNDDVTVVDHGKVFVKEEDGWQFFVDMSIVGATGASIEGPQGATGPQGADGLTPTIGENGNWYIDGVDTGLPSKGDVTLVSYNAGQNIEIVDDTISAKGYVYNKEKESFSVGSGTATGSHSFAEGSNNIASGDCSHAEGQNTVASSGAAHAEGFRTTASGWNSHAEGGATKAEGDNSHAEGSNTTASGVSSHSEGSYTTASGKGSHVEGNYIAAIGEYSHAEGTTNHWDCVDYSWETNTNTITLAAADPAIPYFKITHEGNVIILKVISSNEEFTVYNVDKEIPYDYQNSRLEAFYGVAEGDSSHREGHSTVASGHYSHAEGTGSKSKGTSSHAEGEYTEAIGYGSHAEGHNTKAEGNYSHAEGYNTTASEYLSHAEGNSTTSSGRSSHSEGSDTVASGESSHAEGSASIGTGSYSHAEGVSTYASGQASHAEGSSTTASGSCSHAEGSGTIAYGSSSHAEGNPGYINTYRQQEQYYEWDEEGNENIYYVDNYNWNNWEEGTNIINCVNLSIYNFNTGDVLIIEKYDEYDNLIEGPITTKIVNIDYENSQIEIDNYLYFDAQYTQLALIKYAAIGDYSHREGVSTTASGYASHTEGTNTTAQGDYSHAEGSGSIGLGQSSHAEGSSTTAFGWHSHAEGYDTQSNGEASHAEGIGSKAEGGCSHAEGYDTTASGNTSHAEGRDTTASGWFSHTEGRNTIAYNDYEHAQGCYNVSNNGVTSDKQTIHSIGIGTYGANKNAQEVMQNGDHYIIGIGGYDGTNINEASTLQEVINGLSSGEGIIGPQGATGPQGPSGATPEIIDGYWWINGENTGVPATGQGGTDVQYTAGNNIDITDNAISAKGYTFNDEKKSIATGIDTQANGYYSHAEGSGTIAGATGAHAEGVLTSATGFASHAEGLSTQSTKDGAHAEGYGTVASGDLSHTEGFVTITNNAYEHAQGSLNVSNNGPTPDKQTIHSIGIGANGARKNAQEVMQNGDHYIIGIGGYDGTNIDTAQTLQQVINSGGGSGEGGQTYYAGTNIEIENNNISAIGYRYNKENVSFATGSAGTKALGYCSHAEGVDTEAEGEGSHAEGWYAYAKGQYSHCEGYFSEALGSVSHAEGYDTTASGTYSHTEGSASIGVGHASHAEGNYTQANGNYSHAEGNYTIASGESSHTEGSGTIAVGNYAHAGGEYSEAQHDKSFAHGDHVVTSNESMAVFGKYSTKLTDWNVRLQVGDGTSTESTRNIFVVQGMTPEGNEGGVHAKGAFKPDAGYINDFAEYFEWTDGNINNEDRIGILVELDGNKITPANSAKDCIGAVSATSGFTGGACSLEWHGKYLRDKWGRLQKEQIGDVWVPVLNPNYDPNKTYIPREKRPEWAPIGLVGQVLVRQDGSLKVGGKAGCKNGIAIDATKGFRVLQIIDEETAVLLIR